MHNFEGSKKRFPSSGQGASYPEDFPTGKATTTLDLHLFLGYILPYVE